MCRKQFENRLTIKNVMSKNNFSYRDFTLTRDIIKIFNFEFRQSYWLCSDILIPGIYINYLRLVVCILYKLFFSGTIDFPSVFTNCPYKIPYSRSFLHVKMYLSIDFQNFCGTFYRSKKWALWHIFCRMAYKLSFDRFTFLSNDENGTDNLEKTKRILVPHKNCLPQSQC